MIVEDLIDEARLTEDQDGFTAERSFIVEGVSGNAATKLYSALSDSNIPQFGEPHPSIPNIQAVDRQAVPIESGNQIRVEVTYATPSDEDAATSEAGNGKALVTSSLTNEQTHFDIHGNLIKASYSFGANSISTNYSAVEVQRPQTRVTLSRKESAMPKSHIKNYLGRINSVEWSGFAPQTWLCSGISVRESGGSFEVDYSFEYREERWKGELVLPLTSAEAQDNPIDKDTGNGYALFDVYKTADFNSLGLSF